MNLQQTFHGGKRWLIACIILVGLAIGIAPTQVARAATIDVPCNVTDLVNAINTANSNGEADTLNLATACTYTLTAPLDILADGGNPLTIEGNGATISGNNVVQVFNVTSGVILDLNNMMVTNGFVSGVTTGGGISNDVGSTLTLTNSTVSGNVGTSGGIFNVGTLTLTNSTISGNTADSGGGGIYNVAGGTVSITNSTISNNTTTNSGGGITNEGTLTLTNSTVSSNSASDGGGIVNDGGGSTLTLTNSTVSTNRGGGIFNFAGGTVSIINSTVASNGDTGIFNDLNGTLALTNSTVANHADYGIFGSSGPVNLTNTILANNNTSDCVYTGAITPSGGNLIEDGSCSIAGALSGDPMLGGLTGSPAYFPLLAGSPAIDTGDNSVCPATDQRGAARPFDGDGNGNALCDLGSFELNPTTDPTTEIGGLPPPPDTPRCEDQNLVMDGVVRASVSDALDYAVFCRVLYANGAPVQWLGGDLYNAGSIGHQGVLDLGVVQAVDVYSPVGMTTFEGGVVICLRGQGTMILLAARNAPRVPEVVATHTASSFPSFTCATLLEPGTLVLVRNTP